MWHAICLDAHYSFPLLPLLAGQVMGGYQTTMLCRGIPEDVRSIQWGMQKVHITALYTCHLALPTTTLVQHHKDRGIMEASSVGPIPVLFVHSSY